MCWRGPGERKKSSFRGPVGAGWAPGAELQLVPRAALWLCFLRGCRSCSSIPSHWGLMLHRDGKAVSACAVAGTPPVPSLECTWQRVPPHPVPPNSACCSSFPAAETGAWAAPALAEEPAAGTEGWGDAHTQGDVQGSRRCCTGLQPAPFRSLLLSKTTALHMLWS